MVFIHPFGTTLGTRLDQYYLQNVIGQPLETAITLPQLICGGLFDRYPELKILAAHGGGYLPSYIGRSDHARDSRPDARTCRKKPREYLGSIWNHALAGLRLFGGRDVDGSMPWLNSACALKTWEIANEYGIVMDLEGLVIGGDGPSVPTIIELARRYPNVRVVLDHMLEPPSYGKWQFYFKFSGCGNFASLNRTAKSATLRWQGGRSTLSK